MSARTKVMRKVVRIDEERCNGCGVCVPACAEGALQIVDGKAKLVSDRYCDGLGDCLGECPEGAITIEEREAEEFDEAAAARHARSGACGHDHCAEPHTGHAGARPAPGGGHADTGCRAEDSLPCGCPSASVTRLEGRETGVCHGAPADWSPKLGHWPVQLTLVPPGAPFLRGADVVLTADCVPFAYPRLHPDFLEGRAVMVACPKLDDFPAHQAKLTDILRVSGVKSLSVVRMEVPCCSGLTHLAREAIRGSGQEIPLEEVVIGIRGSRVA